MIFCGTKAARLALTGLRCLPVLVVLLTGCATRSYSSTDHKWEPQMEPQTGWTHEPNPLQPGSWAWCQHEGFEKRCIPE